MNLYLIIIYIKLDTLSFNKQFASLLINYPQFNFEEVMDEEFKKVFTIYVQVIIKILFKIMTLT